MEEKIAINAELQKATSRRSRKDEQGRDFLCGCGKRYLSYPALYTHIKTKHQGRQPEGTQKSGPTQIVKRVKGKLQQQALKSISSYFQKEDLRIFSQLEEGLIGSVPVGSRIKKDALPKQIYDCYLSLLKEKQIKLSTNSSLQLSLIVYLVNVGYHVNDKMYEQFLYFARICRNCFYQYGEELHRTYYSKKEQGRLYFPSFNIHEVQQFPIVSNFIIQVYIPYLQQKQGRDVNMSLMELMVFDFCNWLFIHKLTKIKPSLLKEYKLDYKPVIMKQKVTPSKADHLPQLNSKQIREQNEEQSEQMSDNEDIDDEEGQQGDKKHSGSKEKDSNPLE